MKTKRTHILSLSQKAEKALKEAVHNVIKDHKRTGDPLVVWQNGKVTKISPSHL
jgi:fumarate hydratase class II